MGGPRQFLILIRLSFQTASGLRASPRPFAECVFLGQGLYTAGFVLTPNWALGGNAAKDYLNHTHAPFGFRPLQLVVRGGIPH
jgi:hypothetical protein